MDHHIGCVAKVLTHLCDEFKRDLLTWQVELGDLQRAIIDQGYIQRIVHDPSLKPNKRGLRGLFYRATYDGGKKEMAVIRYDISLQRPEGDEPMRRFIVAKELSHIFDRPEQRTNTAQGIREHLAALKSEKVLSKPPINADKDARLVAIEMLIPYERRRLLMNTAVTSKVIAKLAKDCALPLEFVQIALNPGYNETILALRQKANVADLYDESGKMIRAGQS